MTNPASQPASTPPKTMIGNMPAFMARPPSLPCSSPTSRHVPLTALAPCQLLGRHDHLREGHVVEAGGEGLEGGGETDRIALEAARDLDSLRVPRLRIHPEREGIPRIDHVLPRQLEKTAGIRPSRRRAIHKILDLPRRGQSVLLEQVAQPYQVLLHLRPLVLGDA